MTYNEALEYIIKTYRIGGKQGFEACARVLSKLGDPHKKLKIIHVAGTNGKGSTCAFLQRVLMENGYKTAMFTSPHLNKFNERLNINAVSISDEDFADQILKVKTAIDDTLGAGMMLSYFETLTVMGFNYFFEQNVDAAIIEVGMGGRLDPTNIIESPVLSVICSISLDHTQYLGDDISSIAAEKGGIIKNNCPVVLYSQKAEVYNIINDICKERNSRLFYNNPEAVSVQVISDTPEGMEFSVATEFFRYDNVKLRMFGEYQVYNASNTLTVIHALNELGFNLSREMILSGLFKTFWPGRMEVAMKKPLLILESAHNPDGAAQVRSAIARYFSKKQITLVVGVMKDKAYDEVLNTLSERADKIILTCPAYISRSALPDALYDVCAYKERVILTEVDFNKAMDTAFDATDDDGVIFVSGSQYLVGDVKTYLNKEVNTA